jgi:hypothetical protein
VERTPPLILRSEADEVVAALSALSAAGQLQGFESAEDVFTLKHRYERLASGALVLTVILNPTDRLSRAFAALRADKVKGRLVKIEHDSL